MRPFFRDYYYSKNRPLLSSLYENFFYLFPHFYEVGKFGGFGGVSHRCFRGNCQHTFGKSCKAVWRICKDEKWKKTAALATAFSTSKKEFNTSNSPLK